MRKVDHFHDRSTLLSQDFEEKGREGEIQDWNELLAVTHCCFFVKKKKKKKKMKNRKLTDSDL